MYCNVTFTVMLFLVYVETASSTTSTTLAFTIGAASGTRSWKVTTVVTTPNQSYTVISQIMLSVRSY
jgi:hypothetical protein